MIGLKGLHGAFDAQAFNDHAAQLGYRGVVVNSPQEARALINQATGKVGLYGFSAGANAAHSLLGEKGIRDKVDQVVTVAPFHGSQTQNFKGTNWDNYPDYSSRGIAPQGRGFDIQTRQHTKEAQREAATGLGQATTTPPAEQFGTFPAAAPPATAQPPSDAPPAQQPATNLPPQDAPPAPRPPADIPAPAPAPAPITVGKALGPMFGKLPEDQRQATMEGLGKLSQKDQAAMLLKGPEAIVAELARQGNRNPSTVVSWLNGDFAGLGYPGYPGGFAQFSKDVAAAQAAYTKSLGATPPAPAAPGKRSEAPGGQFGQFAAGGRDVGAPPAVEPGQLPGVAEWETQPGGLFRGIDPQRGPLDPRSHAVLNPAWRGQVFDPDVFREQQIEQQQYQQNLDPRGFRALAKGGHVAKDEPVVVGEQGPETFVPDQPGTVFPHMPQPDSQPGNIDRWPKGPAIGYPGQYGGVEREIRRQTRAAQEPGIVDMINRGQLQFNPAAWGRWLDDPKDVALGWSRIEDRR